MTDLELTDLLNSLYACHDAKVWAKGKDLSTAWNTCERADWMLWLLGKMVDKPGWQTRSVLVKAACDCAETALRCVPKGETRPLVAIETARRWARGQASITGVMVARAAAADADAAAYAAADAAYAAAAAAAAADADAAAADAAYAADAAAAAAAYADATAKLSSHTTMCALIRQRIPVPYTEGE